jgi:hypothetical protein
MVWRIILDVQKTVVSRSETDLKNKGFPHLWWCTEGYEKEKDAHLTSTISGNKIS